MLVLALLLVLMLVLALVLALAVALLLVGCLDWSNKKITSPCFFLRGTVMADGGGLRQLKKGP